MPNIFIIIIIIYYLRSYSEFHKGVTFLRRYVRTNEGTKEAINRLLELFNTIETYRRIIIILRTNEVLNKCTRLLDADRKVPFPFSLDSAV